MKKKKEKKNGNERMTKDEMLEIMKSEGLDEYRKLVFNITGHPGQCAIINHLNDDSYRVEITEERGNVPYSGNFKSIEEAYYYVVSTLRHIKEFCPEDKRYIDLQKKTDEGEER